MGGGCSHPVGDPPHAAGSTSTNGSLPVVGLAGVLRGHISVERWGGPGCPTSYGYSNPMGHHTSDFRLLWTIPPNPQPPKPPMIDLCPPPPKIRLVPCPPYQTCLPPFSLAQFCTLLHLQTLTVGMN